MKNIYLASRQLSFSFALVMMLCVCALSSLAQQPYEPLTEPLPLESWRWIDFPRTVGKGVRYLHEYQPNQVWFATNNGLVHFDGYEYRWHNEAQGLEGKPVYMVYVTKGGITVAATDYGIFRYAAEGRWEPMLSWAEPGRVTYRSIGEWSGQRLVVGTNLGLVTLQLGHAPVIYTDATQREEALSLVPEADVISFPARVAAHGTFANVSDALEAQDGHMWLAVSLREEDLGYVLRFDPSLAPKESMQKAEVFAAQGSRKFGSSQKLLQAQDGRIWVINDSYRIGINVYDQGKWSQISLGEKLGGDEYAADICQIKNGTIWISGLGKLFSFDGTRWKLYHSPEYNVPGNKIILSPAINGSLWVVGLKSRVIYVDHSDERWMAYPGLNFQDESAAGTWFLDRQGQVVLQSGETWSYYDADDGLIDAPIRLLVTSKGQVWAAGSHQGQAATAYLEGDRWVKRSYPQLSWGIDYRAVFEDREGSLWFGGSVDIDKDRGHRGA
jgi:ligand-binding sensor domain-containing protein